MNRILLSALFLLMGLGVWAGPPSSTLLANRDSSNQQFASVGRIQATFTCTGTWIEPPGGAPDSAPAYFLTAGHCISLDPQIVIRDRAVAYNVTFNYFADTRDAAVPVRASRIAWSTMKGVDLALIELAVSNGELRARGLRPHGVQATAPGSGAPVFWVGAPTSFVPSGQGFLRRGSCSALGSTDVVEASWVWFGQIRNNCPDVYASASGSPLFDAATNRVIGVIGTSTLLSLEGGPDFDCFQNRPCAVVDGGVRVEPDTSYATPAGALEGCFVSGAFDVTLAVCALDDGRQLALDAGRVTATPPVVNGQPPRWDVKLAGEYAYYAWKQVQVGRGDCRDRGGYSEPVSLAATPVIEAPLAAPEGEYLLCVVAGPTPAVDGSWQSFRNPSVLRRTVDGTGLSALPVYSIDYTGLAYRIVFDVQAPAVGSMMFKRGVLAETDCSDLSGDRTLFSVPPVVFEREFPHRICVRMADEAGNWSAPMMYDFGAPALQPFGLRNAASLIRTRQAARGSQLRVEGIELTDRSAFAAPPVPVLGGFRAELTDANGARYLLPMFAIDRTFLDVLLPETAAVGPARLAVFPGGGAELAIGIEITDATPGMFTANYTGFGPPLAYYQIPGQEARPVFSCEPGAFICLDRPVPVTAAETSANGIDLVVYGTGFSRAPLRAYLGTEELIVVETFENRDWPGVDGARLQLPAGTGLRGYQLLRIGSHNLRLLLE